MLIITITYNLLWYNYIRESLDLFFRMEWQVINIVKKIYIITGANGF